MTREVVQIDEQMQAAKSKEGKYLTFAFRRTVHGLKLEVAGWTQLRVPPDIPDSTMGIVNLWGYNIPVKKVKFPHGDCDTELTETTCIVIFEYSKTYKYYLGIMAATIASVLNIAEKNAANTKIYETTIVDQSNNKRVEYDIVSADKSGRHEPSKTEMAGT